MAKRDIDKTPEDLRNEFTTGLKRRLENLAEASEGTGARLSEMAGGLVKEEVFGIPGLLGDLTPMVAQLGGGPMSVQYAADPKFRQAVDEFQKEYGAVGLAAKAGVELSDDFLDEEGELRPEMAGRLLAPGVLYAKGAALLPELRSGIASYVRRLNNEGFFPPQLQPAGGPSIMRSERADGDPRPTVFRNEGEEPVRGIGDNRPPPERVGPRKVQSEKEDMFVSPDNEGVVPTVKDTSDTGTSAFSESGVYSPLRAALENIEIPKGGITAAKLLEKLRGQPRAGTELRSLGIEGYLKSKGDKKISPDEFRDVVGVLSPRYKIKTVFDKPGMTYSGASVAPEPTVYGTMQRLGNSEDNAQNYGVMLFADDSAQIDGSFVSGDPAHDYFGSQLPGFFGHVRFSIQEILDPETGATVRALVVEEIQTDTVKAFNRRDQIEKANPIPSIDEIIQQRISPTGRRRPILVSGYSKKNVDELKSQPGTPPPTREEAEQTQRMLLEQRNDRMKGAIGGKAEYGPMQRMQEVILNADPNYKTLNQMLEDTRAVTQSEETLNSNAMQSIDLFLDSGSSHRGQALNSDITQSEHVFLLQNDLHKARSKDEVESMLRALPVDSLPLSANFTQNLNEIEILENKIRRLVDLWDRGHQSAENRLRAYRPGRDKPQGVFQRMFGGKSDVEQMMEDYRADAFALTAVTALRGKHNARAAARYSEKFEKELLEVRAREPRTSDERASYRRDTPLYLNPDLQRGSVDINGAKQAVDATEVQEGVRYRQSLSGSDFADIADAIGEGDNFDSKTLFPGLVDTVEATMIDLDSLAQLHPALSREAAKTKPLIGNARAMNDNLMTALASANTFTEAQQRTFKRGLMAELDAAQQRAPSFETLRKNINKVLTDEGIGPSFIQKLGLEELPADAMPEISRALLNDDMDLLSDALTRSFQQGQQFSGASRARDMAARPPYMNQNDFMQFATRVLPGEAKKLGADMVIIPPKEEFMAARSSEVGNAREVAQFGVVLEAEDTARRAAQILRKRAAKAKKDDEAPTEFKSQDEVNAFLDEAGFTGALRTEVSQAVQRREIAGNFEKLAKSIEKSVKDGDIKLIVAPNVNFLNPRKLRGHFQNYGKNLDAALAKLNKSGLKVKEATEIKFANPNPSGADTLGKYASGEVTRGTGFGFQPSLPPFRYIDLRDPGTAEVAKKVPSAYKDGGPVDLRPKKLVHSGIGAMARQVM